ncbi:endosomal transmembrane protein, putative [Candida dubliniensis CD36]|uniref:Transmembrane 9 superfamily member n=1 Tax=Candida dubliniensis (strain CD36 / ATCC MYA-646 / CBS 7987 / NCPF 3949 / NRRL Y-17841) TaxID=573826 RepID=B9WKW0_CANDC|nr:endosomal transmembrane protein, putative [Candida dubliniensis CD36]CAX39660.1 endosomal transmembrane protein, putative [Candida dubliniensis CD36]
MLNLISRWYIFNLFITSILAFDFGLGPTYYKHGDKVDLLVNKIESDTTQLPFAYQSLPFVCPPINGAKPVHLSLGELLKGDRIWQSGYQLQFGIDVPCNRLCDMVLSTNSIKRASDLIKEGYVAHWTVDGLPGATTFESNNHRNKYYAAGFPLGFVNHDDGMSYIYNHVMLVIRYHRQKENNNRYTIVGFEVYPKSVIDEQCPGSSKNYENFPLYYSVDDKNQLIESKTKIAYTYSVYWREDNSIDYDSRWELYYENETNGTHVHIHWISFINSIILIFLASLIVMIVLIKVLKKDIANGGSGKSDNTNSGTVLPLTNDIPMDIDGGDSSSAIKNIGSGWKNLINEVNQIPHYPIFLTTLVSAGIQMVIAAMGVISILMINSIGIKNNFFNSHQGAFFSLSIFCISVSGSISSYFGILLHKYLHYDNLNQPYNQLTIIKLSLLFSAALPAFLFLIIFILNFFVWAKESSAALPFGTIVVFLLIFILIQCPLGIIGGYYANYYHKFDRFLLTSKTPPPQSPLYEKSLLNHGEYNSSATNSKSSILSKILSYSKTILVYGLIPFGIVYVELLFIFNSVWLEKTTFYYMYGFLFVTTLMLFIIIIESTIVAIYISLVVYNDPNWIWLSFQVGSSIGWYIYGYSIYYFIKILNVDDFVSGLLYFVYMALASLMIGIASGSVSVLTGLIFIRKIYGAIKVD